MKINLFNQEFLKQIELIKSNNVLDNRNDSSLKICIRKKPFMNNNEDFDIVTSTNSCYPYSHLYIHEPKISYDQSKTIDTHLFLFDTIFI